MGRGRDRGQKRRGFDDEYEPPEWASPPPREQMYKPARQDPAPSGPALDGTVKWFSSVKGFGFVELADGSGDVFLHAAVLEAAGHSSVDPGTKLSVQAGLGQRGRHVTAVLAVDASSAVQGGKPAASRDRDPPGAAVPLEGTVKWFNQAKGFGFVECADGGKDVFVHVSVIQREGLRGLDEGQRVAMKVVKTPKGREAVSLTLVG